MEVLEFLAAADAQLEAELVAAVLRKDRKASAEFVSRYAGPVHAYVKLRLAPANDAAEDLVQEVFLDAWRGLERYRGEAGLASWLMGIARHKVQDHYRRVLRAAEMPEDSGEAFASREDVEQAAVEGERRVRVERTLAQLPETYRVALLWRYWDRRPASDIARETGRTEKAVERLLARARERFRRIYGPE